MAVCLLVTIAVVLFAIGTAIASSKRPNRQDRGNDLRESGLVALLVACLFGLFGYTPVTTRTTQLVHPFTGVKMDTQTSGRSLTTTPTLPRADTNRASNDQLRVWADAAARGDAEEFARLYDSCRDWVLARCRASLSAHDADDACAEVFARTWRHLRAGRTITHPIAWLATVTRNQIAEHHRTTRRAVPAGDLTEQTGTAVQRPDPAPGPCELAAAADIACRRPRPFVPSRQNLDMPPTRVQPVCVERQPLPGASRAAQDTRQ